MTIHLDPTAEQNQILASVRKVLADRFPVARLRGHHRESPDRDRLHALAELGAFGLGADEASGGAGFGIMEDMLLFVELGRHLVTPGALAITMGARLAAALGRPDLARRMMAGQQPVAIANALRPFAFDRLENLPVHLIDAQQDSLALLWNDEGIGLLRCEALQAQAVDSTDRSVLIHRSTLSQAALEGHLPCSATSLVRRTQLLLAAMLLGMAEATRDMAVDYARLRTQFGKPIGAFQAVKHRCANMAIHAEVLRAQLVFAALAEQDGWPDAQFQNDACRMLAAPHALANARSNIQVHGGIGFTAECDAHLYLLRAHLYENLGGGNAATGQRLLHQGCRGPALEVRQ
jgi:alkylation response protein AidB-like acyl-CoA dehydrogenase